uniref:Retrovirus-related Pol polyprotein from transposon TNT 1-94-like beta-barrel domain-containing protein n=1 Tax=Cajanus cajan TaxID=3821 RepID=A0A151U0G7_CAJCA|nr:hypothetical protein KK1_005333 [Cajanus cajan]
MFQYYHFDNGSHWNNNAIDAPPGFHPKPLASNPYQYNHTAPYTQQKPPQAFVTNTNQSTSQQWFPNSGASFHVTNNANNIQQLTPFEGPNHIFIGNGEGLPIDFVGSSNITRTLNSHFSLALHQMLHVPQITKILISISKFARDND